VLKTLNTLDYYCDMITDEIKTKGFNLSTNELNHLRIVVLNNTVNNNVSQLKIMYNQLYSISWFNNDYTEDDNYYAVNYGISRTLYDKKTSIIINVYKLVRSHRINEILA
jgi:hypothetical protein